MFTFFGLEPGKTSSRASAPSLGQALVEDMLQDRRKLDSKHQGPCSCLDNKGLQDLTDPIRPYSLPSVETLQLSSDLLGHHSRVRNGVWFFSEGKEKSYCPSKLTTEEWRVGGNGLYGRRGTCGFDCVEETTSGCELNLLRTKNVHLPSKDCQSSEFNKKKSEFSFLCFYTVLASSWVHAVSSVLLPVTRSYGPLFLYELTRELKTLDRNCTHFFPAMQTLQ